MIFSRQCWIVLQTLVISSVAGESDESSSGQLHRMSSSPPDPPKTSYEEVQEVGGDTEPNPGNNKADSNCDVLVKMNADEEYVRKQTFATGEKRTGLPLEVLWRGVLRCARNLVTEGNELQKLQKKGTLANTEYARDLTQVDYTLDYLSSNELINAFVIAHRLQKKAYLRTLAQTVGWEKHMQPYHDVDVGKYPENDFQWNRNGDAQEALDTLVARDTEMKDNEKKAVKDFIKNTREEIWNRAYLPEKAEKEAIKMKELKEKEEKQKNNPVKAMLGLV